MPDSVRRSSVALDRPDAAALAAFHAEITATR
jgi:hypothetical protein